MEKRPDLKRVESERSAQAKNVSMAKAAFGPRLNAFGSWEEDSHAVGWTGANNWVAGAELQFDLFSRGSKRAALAREKALAERATAAQTGFQDAIRLEVRSAYYAGACADGRVLHRDLDDRFHRRRQASSCGIRSSWWISSNCAGSRA